MSARKFDPMLIVRTLYAAAADISEMGCTCAPERRSARPGHALDCVGERIARDHLRKAGLPVRYLPHLDLDAFCSPRGKR